MTLCAMLTKWRAGAIRYHSGWVIARTNDFKDFTIVLAPSYARGTLADGWVKNVWSRRGRPTAGQDDSDSPLYRDKMTGPRSGI